jgi:hypothetical protein
MGKVSQGWEHATEHRPVNHLAKQGG